MEKFKSQKGISRMVVLVAVIAVALIAIIAIRQFTRGTEQVLEDMDNRIVIAAERKAKLEYMQNDLINQVVYDAENKKFVDPEKARFSIEPYGSAKDHKGKYLLVTIENGENISSEWVAP